ncbi:MAG: hydrogenase maturation protease [Candidatus Eisenbacteria bacterium]|nr:hydrogenase maturation protease [Candidatus Eisenbacteria bacterium]
MKTVVVGVGSSVLTDDAVGLFVARSLAERFASRDDVEVLENEEAGFTLLEDAVGYDRMVVIDSIMTGAEPGTLFRFALEDLEETIHAGAPHGLNLATVIEFGRRQGLAVPREIVIYAVEAEDTLTLGEELTPRVASRVEPIAEEIAAEMF